MMEYELKNILYEYINDICHYSQMQVFATSSYQKNYFQQQIDDRIDALINTLMQKASLSAMSGYLQTQQQGAEQQGQQPVPNELLQQIPVRLPPQSTPEPPAPSQSEPIQPENRQFTVSELANYDGSGGKPAYVAVNGTVYDVSNQVRWAGGTHFGLIAGHDLTSQFMGCHQGMVEILGNFPKVGTLVK